MDTSQVERRIAKLARRTARLCMQLRAEGCDDGADRLAKLATEICESMRSTKR